MKVVILKSYLKNSTVSYNYGDDYTEVWHKFNALEEVKEVTPEDYEVLKRAVNHFNSKRSRDYTLELMEIMEDEEVDSLLSNFKEYEKKEIAKAEKLERERKEKALALKAKSEAKKHDRVVKKFAKELNLSEDEVRVMLANK